MSADGGHSQPHFNGAGLCTCACRSCTSLGWCACLDCPCDCLGDRGGEHVPDDCGELETGDRIVGTFTAPSPPPWLPPPRIAEWWPRAELIYGTCASTLEFLPFNQFPTPGQLWREALAETSAALAGVSGGGFSSLWTCFRCALPPAPEGDTFSLGARRIRRVRSALVPAWQAGKLPGVFAV